MAVESDINSKSPKKTVTQKTTGRRKRKREKYLPQDLINWMKTEDNKTRKTG
jgi:hypothetical protein